jgi:hypothetical protein
MNQHLEKLERNIDNVTRGNSLQVRNASWSFIYLKK